MVRWDLRVVTIDVPKQEIMTRDNVPATVECRGSIFVSWNNSGGGEGENYWKAPHSCADHLAAVCLASRRWMTCFATRCDQQKLQEIIDKQTEPWGVKVTAVEVKEVALPTA